MNITGKRQTAPVWPGYVARRKLRPGDRRQLHTGQRSAGAMPRRGPADQNTQRPRRPANGIQRLRRNRQISGITAGSGQRTGLEPPSSPRRRSAATAGQSARVSASGLQETPPSTSSRGALAGDPFCWQGCRRYQSIITRSRCQPTRPPGSSAPGDMPGPTAPGRRGSAGSAPKKQSAQGAMNNDRQPCQKAGAGAAGRSQLLKELMAAHRGCGEEPSPTHRSHRSG